jgi:RND family efflux transporter MFP subunit
LTLTTSQPGWIDAFEETPLFPKVTGFVAEVLVDIGDAVSKDQTLVKLAIPEMHDELEQKEAMVVLAEAEIRQAEATVQAVKAAADTTAAKVELAQAGIVRAQADHARWQSEHTRIQSLAAERAVTEKLVDETLSQLRAAEAGQQEAAAHVTAAKAALAEAQAHIQKAEADQGAAAARLRVAQADLARTQTLAAYATIKAPFDGVVTRRNVDTGHYVQPANGGGAKPLVVVARTDVVRVFVDVPELEAPLVDGGDRGDTATVSVQALGGREFEARVTRTGWSLDASNRALRTEIDIPNTDGALRPGMYAVATIVLDRRSEAIALPIAALVREGPNTYCCTVESGSIARRPIQLGLRIGEEVEVVSGLDAGQLVVLARAESLKQGQPVEVLPPEQK